MPGFPEVSVKERIVAKSASGRLKVRHRGGGLMEFSAASQSLIPIAESAAGDSYRFPLPQAASSLLRSSDAENFAGGAP